jgi:hypothetical protein
VSRVGMAEAPSKRTLYRRAASSQIAVTWIQVCDESPVTRLGMVEQSDKPGIDRVSSGPGELHTSNAANQREVLFGSFPS